MYLSLKRIEERTNTRRTYKRKSRERKEKISYINLLFLQTYIFKLFKNHWLKIKFFKILLEPYWSNSWYTISVSILYTTTLERAMHYCTQQIICWKGLIFTRKKIVCGYSSPKRRFVKVWSSPKGLFVKVWSLLEWRLGTVWSSPVRRLGMVWSSPERRL